MLDVGCGTMPRGDVNVDLLVSDDDYRDAIIPQNIENFVKADVRFLPFRDSCFQTVFCSHLLEHLEDPDVGLKELLRVSGKAVVVRVPFFLFEIVSWLLEPRKFFWMKQHHKKHYWCNPFKTDHVQLRFISLKFAALNKAVFSGKLKFPIPYETETVFLK